MIPRAQLAAAISAGLDAYCTATGAFLHPGVRSELQAHVTAAITRSFNPQPTATTPPPAAWWNRD